MSYYDSELPSHVSGKKIRHHLSSLRRSGVGLEQVSRISGVPGETIQDIIQSRTDKVPFEIADPIYNVVAADRPLETVVDSNKALKVLSGVAEIKNCTEREAGEFLKLPAQSVESLLSGGEFTLRDWQVLTEKSKKLGVRITGSA